MAIRVAVTGRTATPPLFDTLVALGRDRDARAPRPGASRCSRRRDRRPRPPGSALIVVVGIATGALTQFLQGILPVGWSQVANAISPWLLVAFLLGSRMPGRAGRPLRASGRCSRGRRLLRDGQLRYGYGGGTGRSIFWGLGRRRRRSGLRAGWSLAARAVHRRRAIALGLLAAVSIAEGYQRVLLAEPPVGLGFILAGLLVPLALGRSRHDRLGGYAAHGARSCCSAARSATSRSSWLASFTSASEPDAI